MLNVGEKGHVKTQFKNNSNSLFFGRIYEFKYILIKIFYT